MINETVTGNGRTLTGALNEFKEELKDFVDTRLQMLKSEMKQKVAMLRMVVPMLLVAAVLGVLGFLFLSIALVAAIANLIGWGWSFLVIGVFYAAIGGATALLAVREISNEGITPTRTMKVLKQDQVWLQNEARSQL